MTKKDKRILIVGAVIILSIVVVAAAYLYYAAVWNENVERIESISIDIAEYYYSDEYLFVEFNVTNPSEDILRGHFEVRSFELITWEYSYSKIMHRSVVGEVQRGLDIQPVTISSGNTDRVYYFRNLNITEGFYKVDIRFITPFLIYNFDPLLVL